MEYFIPGFIFLAYLLCSLGFYLYRKNYEPIRSRGWVMVLCSITSLFVGVLILTIYQESFKMNTRMSCYAVYIVASCYLPQWVMPFFFRALTLRYKWDYNQLKLSPDGSSTQKLNRYRIISTDWFMMIIYVAASILNLILYIGFSYVSSSNPIYGFTPETRCEFATFELDAAWAALLLSFVISGVILLWSVKDGYDFKNELKIFAISFPLVFILWAVFGLIGLPKFAAFYMILLGGVITVSISLNYPTYKTYNSQWLKVSYSDQSIHMPQVETTDLFTFCMDNSDLFDAFRHYCVEMWCAENVQFYTDVQSFKKTEHSKMPAQASAIFSLYMSENAPFPINVEEATKRKILSRIDAGDVDISLFKEAEIHVLKYMKQDTFAKFKFSQRLHHAWREAGLGDLDATLEARRSSSISVVKVHTDQVKLNTLA